MIYLGKRIEIHKYKIGNTCQEIKWVTKSAVHWCCKLEKCNSGMCEEGCGVQNVG